MQVRGQKGAERARRKRPMSFSPSVGEETAVLHPAMSRALPMKLENLSHSVAEETTLGEVGTRCAASPVNRLGDEEPEPDSERPTLPIPRAARPAADAAAPPYIVGASLLHLLPSGRSVSDLVARLESTGSAEPISLLGKALIGGLDPPTPSTLPVVLTQPPVVSVEANSKPPQDHVTRFNRSIRGARELSSSRRYVVAAAAAVGLAATMVTIGRFRSPAAAPLVAAGGSVVNETLLAGSFARPATPDDASSTPAPAMDLPSAPLMRSAKTEPSTPVPAHARKGVPPPSKRSSEIDFGI